MNQGVVKLKEGSRVIDAIEAAGGETENADLSLINLAYMLQDGEKIYVPSTEDKENMDNELFLDSIKLENKNSVKSLKVNINTASAEEFESIPGIGQTIASRIVLYRSENGKFKNIEDIKNVSGIGESKYNDIKNYIYIK